MSKVLITGSRMIAAAATPFILAKLDGLKKLGWSVIVGDANGVDFIVAQGCIERDIPFVCYGLGERARNADKLSYPVYIRFRPNNPSLGYYERDEKMATECDSCLAVWNGYSGGTRHTYEYATQLGKTVWVKTFRTS